MRWCEWALLWMCCIACGLCAEEGTAPFEEWFTSSLDEQDTAIPTTVNHVSVISGEWVHSQTDLYVAGPEPIVLARGYSCEMQRDEQLGFRWKFHMPSLIVQRDDRLRARYRNYSGLGTVHESKIADRHGSIPLSVSKGLTNVASGEVSGRSNPYNIRIIPHHNDFVTSSGYGEETYFQETSSLPYYEQGKEQPTGRVRTFQVTQEKRRNGNQLCFEAHAMRAYDASKRHEYGVIRWRTTEGEKELIARGSNGQQVRYLFSTFKEAGGIERYALREVKGKHLIPERYTYSHRPPKDEETCQEPLLIKRCRPDGRFQKILYYRLGNNRLLHSQSVQLNKKDEDGEKEWRLKRVRKLISPCGKGRTDVTTHTFIYKKRNFSGAGSTLVYDAHQHPTRYAYNREHRLTSCERLDEHHHVYSSEHYVWDDLYVVPLLERLFKREQAITQRREEGLYIQLNPDYLDDDESDNCNTLSSISSKDHTQLTSKTREGVSPGANLPLFTPPGSIPLSHPECAVLFARYPMLTKNQKGHLLGRYVRDDKKRVLKARFFTYDASGNITSETLYGNLTGNGRKKVSFCSLKLPHRKGTDRYRRTFKYTSDHLLVSEKEENGKEIRYCYSSRKRLLRAKYIVQSGVIIFRHFYHYDATATLTQEIRDDGCGVREDDLTGVTERHLTSYRLRTTPPLGLPRKILEREWDPATGTIQLVRKRLCRYSPEGRLIAQTHYDANGKRQWREEWGYDARGNLTLYVDGLGQTVHKQYDRNNNLIREWGTGLERRYSYDFADRLIEEESYDPIDHTCLVTIHQYDEVGNRVATIDPYGNETSYTYDRFNRLIRTTLPGVFDGERNLIYPTFSTEYDALDHPITMTDACGHTTRTRYNIRGNSTRTLHPDGTVERSLYAPDGKLVCSIARNGTETYFQRDLLGRVLVEEQIDSNKNILTQQRWSYQGARLAAYTDAEGRVTTYRYDRGGRLIEECTGRKQTQYTYDDLQRLQHIKEWYGDDPYDCRITTFTRDVLDRVLEERRCNGRGEVQQLTRYTYNQAGQKIRTDCETAAGWRVTRVEYNHRQQPILQVDGEGRTTHIAYNHSYLNALGQRVLSISTTDSYGTTREEIYDALGRITEVWLKDPFGTPLSSQEILYDAVGRKMRTIDTAYERGWACRHVVSAWRYHSNGEEAETIQAVDTPDQQITRHLYNGYGQKEQMIKPSGLSLYYTYDPLGRLATLVSSDQTISYAYHYNRRHQLLSIEDREAEQITTLAYDIDGHLQEEYLAHGLALAYTYDRLGRIASLTLPDDSSVIYTQDALGMRQVARYRNEDLLYRHTHTQYDRSGLLLEADLAGKGGTLHTTYDLTGRPLSIAHPHWQQEMQYDSGGRLTSKTTRDPHGEVTGQFAYDALHHLVSETGVATHTYQVDALHDRKQCDDTSYQVNALHQLLSQGQWRYTYDGEGGLIAKESHDQPPIHYAYDALGRLIAVDTPEERITYTYDPLNRRLTTTRKGRTIRYLYQGQNEIGAVDEEGNLESFRVLGIGIEAEMGAAIALELHGCLFIPIHDERGSVCCLLDAATGDPVETYRYSAFGCVTIYASDGTQRSTSAVNNPWQFVSKRVAPETGWIDFGMRWYDPQIGRWTTPDPALFIDGANLYAYLLHNPLNHYDARGLNGQELNASLGWIDWMCSWILPHDVPPIRDDVAFERCCHLPSIDDDVRICEERNEMLSHHYQLDRPEHERVRFTFINGINTWPSGAKSHSLYLSNLVGGYNVHGTYNATHAYFYDPVECIKGLFGIATAPVHELIKNWQSLALEGPEDLTIIHVCHSQGAIHTRNALLSISEELRQKIKVIAVAPGGYLVPETAADMVHFRAYPLRDFIPYLDRPGMRRAAAGNTIETLSSHSSAFFHDHSFQSPTYHDAMKNKINKFMGIKR